MPEITPPKFYEFSEILIEDSGLLPEKRFQEYSVKLKLDDIINLFKITVEQSLAYEAPTLILGNKPFSDKINAERIRIDDRLERLCDIMEKAGIQPDVFLQFLYLERNKMLDEMTEINETLREMDIQTNGL